jgi:hypothetical protein
MASERGTDLSSTPRRTAPRSLVESAMDELDRPNRLGDLVIALVVGACVASLVILYAVFLWPLSAHGEVRLTRGEWATGQPCAGSGPTAAIREGARVMAIAYLGEPNGPETRLGPGRAVSSHECVFPFSIDGIPRGATQYDLAVIDDSGIVAVRYDLSEHDLASAQEIDAGN